MPRGSTAPENTGDVGGDSDAADGPSFDDDNKLYCVCRSKYNADRVMIACDRYADFPFMIHSSDISRRCDDWYHTQCVNMPDLEIELVDQFVCPVCTESTLIPPPSRSISIMLLRES
jgi:COMPASS component SPP1